MGGKFSSIPGLIIKNAKWYYLSIFGMGRVDLT